MQVRFILTMYDLIVDGQQIDQVVIDWTEELPTHRVMAISREWVDTNNYLTKRMVGLQRVGESNLEIDPIDEPRAENNRFTL